MNHAEIQFFLFYSVLILIVLFSQILLRQDRLALARCAPPTITALLLNFFFFLTQTLNAEKASGRMQFIGSTTQQVEQAYS